MDQSHKVGEYARISDVDEIEEGHSAGVGRQQADTGTLLRLRGWSSGGQYVDDDLSAYKVSVERPDFERLVEDLETGKLDGIVGYDVDRLFRQPSDLERVIRIYDKRPGLVFATVQGDINLMTPDGRTMARVLVAFANKASMDTSRRVSRLKLERAMEGNVSSNYRAFGWDEDGTLRETESSVLLKAIVDVLDNHLGLYVICDALNTKGILTVRGNSWKTSAMRRVLTAPRIAGLVVYRNELLLDTKSGKPIKGNWEPLVDKDTWQRLCEILQPRKGTYPERKRKYLLSGIARCGRCGSGMTGWTKGTKSGYLCRSKDSGGCAGVGITSKIDEQVTKLILAYYDTHQVEQDDETFTGQGRLSEISEKIAELMVQYREGLSGGIVFPNIKLLEDEQRELLAAKSKVKRARKRVTSVREEWPGLELARKQAVISEAVEAVVIRPSGRTGVFDPSRVSVIWREDEQPAQSAQESAPELSPAPA